jgi:hypothetical protein
MTTIYRKSASRLTVAEAKRLVCEAVPKEPAVDFFVAPDGSIKVELNHEANTAEPFINTDFLDACGTLDINPRMTHRPVIAGYTGDGYQDVMYSITHDEFVRYADLHGVAVTVGDAPSVGQAQPEPVPAPAIAAQVEQPRAAQVEPVQAAPAQSAETPVTQAKAKRRTWWDVSSTYIAEVMQAGQYATAKELYRALEEKTGPESPFDKGVGAHRGSLFVREMAQPLSMKTIQNNWMPLRKLAKI